MSTILKIIGTFWIHPSSVNVAVVLQKIKLPHYQISLPYKKAGKFGEEIVFYNLLWNQ